MASLTRGQVETWLDAYYEAWREADPQSASGLFASDALYVVTPYEEPWPDGERMTGRDQIAEFWGWVTKERIRFFDGGYDLWAVNGDEAYARWWADLEIREEGYWAKAEGVLKLKFSQSNGQVLCSELREWNPIEPDSARQYEPHPKDLQ
jgi:hypothetical protein